MRHSVDRLTAFGGTLMARNDHLEVRVKITVESRSPKRGWRIFKSNFFNGFVYFFQTKTKVRKTLGLLQKEANRHRFHREDSTISDRRKAWSAVLRQRILSLSDHWSHKKKTLSFQNRGRTCAAPLARPNHRRSERIEI